MVFRKSESVYCSVLNAICWYRRNCNKSIHCNILLSLSKYRAYLQPLCDKSLIRTTNLLFISVSLYYKNIHAVVKFFNSVITRISRLAVKFAQYVKLYQRFFRLQLQFDLVDTSCYVLTVTEVTITICSFAS